MVAKERGEMKQNERLEDGTGRKNVGGIHVKRKEPGFKRVEDTSKYLEHKSKRAAAETRDCSLRL